MRRWFERDPKRLEAERKFWSGAGFIDDGSSTSVAFRGTIDMQVGEPGSPPTTANYELRVTYPAAFPYRPPEVEFITPRIRRSDHQSPTGAPCLFPTRAWTQFVPASEVHNAIRRWLRGFITGSFPRELRIYELPEYFFPSPLTMLITPETLEQASVQKDGRFSFIRAGGRNLAVMRTVNQEQVARELLDGLGIGPEVKQKVCNGRCFRLPEQPPPMKNTTELSAYLFGHGHQLQVGRSPAEEGFVGLSFSDEVLGEERLLVLDYSAAKTGNMPAQGWPLRAPWVYLVSPGELFKRLQGVHKVDELQESHVTVLGAGAIGSSLALDLTREGVGGMVLCDPDRLRPGNVIRHALDLFSSGQLKAPAVERAVNRVNPYGETWTETDNLDNPATLANLMRPDHPSHPTDLVVSAIGDDTIETMICELAVREETAAVLFVRTVHNGALVRMMLLRPGQRDACIECLRLHAEDGHRDFICEPNTGQLPEVHDAGCATAADPGAGLASRQAAVFGAKRALTVLLEQKPDANHWLWVDKAIPDAKDSRLHQPETMHSAFLPSHAECPICSF